MKKRIMCIAAAIAATVAFAGCKSAANVEGNQITVDKKGVITGSIIESFDKEYYNEQELKNEIDQEISSYNQQAGEDTIEVKTYNVNKQQVNLEIEYQSANAYAEFNQNVFFTGTVQEALDAGYTFEGTFTVIKKGKEQSDILKGEDIKAFLDHNVVIFQEFATITVPGNILYMSRQMDIVSKKQASVSIDSAGTDADNTKTDDPADTQKQQSSADDESAGEAAEDTKQEETELEIISYYLDKPLYIIYK